MTATRWTGRPGTGRGNPDRSREFRDDASRATETRDRDGGASTGWRDAG